MRTSQNGFTLIELLVVTSIIGILASIAIPQYAGYKAQAVDASAQSSLRNASTAMEAFAVEHGGSYEDATVPGLVANGFRASADVELVIVDTEPTSFRLRACGNGGSSPSFLYDSDVGRSVPDAGTCS